MTQNNQSYTAMARWLHWAVAGMIVVQFVLAELAERAEHADQLLRQLGLLANHKSVGITILALAVIRILYRLVRRPPALPRAMPGWQVTASHVSHWSLYVLLFALPISGWLMSSASAYSVSWFGLFQLPDLVGADPEFKELMEEIHEALGYALYAVAGLHILAALKHAFIDRDGVLSRMSSVPSLALFALIIVGGLVWLASPGQTRARQDAPAPTATAKAPASSEQTSVATADRPSGTPQDSTEETTPVTSAAPDRSVDAESPQPDPVQLTIRPPADSGSDTAVSNPAPAPAETAPGPAPVVEPEKAAAKPAPLPAWEIDYDASFIRFTGDQAGADFTGKWTDWQAQIRFSGDRLADSAFDVTINTAGVDTRDEERDGVLSDPEWFDSGNHPQAFYRASRFEADSDGHYRALGELTIKGQPSPVSLEFTVTADGQRRVIEASTRSRLLVGQALLDRLALGVGTGEWEDTEWVGQEVRVDVRVEARIPE